MSTRLLLARFGAARLNTPLSRHVRLSHTRAGGLLSPDASRTLPQRPWPMGALAIHNAGLPAVRSISFVRALPRLVSKFAMLGAAGGGAVVAGLSYIQFQATQAGGFVLDGLRSAGDKATGAANELFSGASSIYDQTRRGWQKTKEDVEVPEWLKNILGGGESGGNRGGDGQEPPREPKQAATGGAALGGATAAAFGYDKQDDGDERPTEEVARDDQMMMLTKKMIQIRSLLQTIGQSESLTLPSIVVIGSQSSGKSSVLEALVGHGFLPKGSNMVTRRPIELTLVNTPNAKAEYGEFPATMPGRKITDFDSVRRTLTDLNLAVSDEECVTDDPIQLRIYGPNIPDLSLIDLPGYIQVTNTDQPPELKRKIEQLCERYIQAPNVILAISAADVDLANSTALRASRKVDPRGERTIGVITKMDLVEAERGAALLNDKKYGLRLGYVGVVCKLPPTSQSTSLFNRSSSNISQAIIKNEKAYFSGHPRVFGEKSGLEVGTPNLRRKLMNVLEITMAGSLKNTSEAIRTELAETTYEFKVQYNDRPLSAESYLAESLDAFKHSFRGFTDSFGHAQLKELLKRELDQQVLDILAQRYWNRPIENLLPREPDLDDLKDLPKAPADDPVWRHKLDTSSAALTKLGVGRLATTVVATALQNNIGALIESSTFAAHPSTRASILSASENILRDLSFDTSDELEICLKPYKYRIELEDSEWSRGRENAQNLLKEEIKSVELAIKAAEGAIGGRKKARDVMAFIDRVKSGQVVLENDGIGGAGGFSASLLAKGREAAFLRDRAAILQMRLMAVKSKQCASKANKYYCPEVFLDAVADKLTATADLFLDAELLSKFYYSFPRALDTHLGRGLSQEEVERFAREDPKVRRHLDVVKRKDLLEHVLQEMDALRQLEARERGRGSKAKSKERRGGWGLF